MDIDALPTFELTFEGYCQAVTTYALTASPYILPWLAMVHDMLASGKLVWEPARTTQERLVRLQAIHDLALAISFYSKHRLAVWESSASSCSS